MSKGTPVSLHIRPSTIAVVDSLSSMMNTCILDDGTLGDITKSLLPALPLANELGESRGLSLNPSKCDIGTLITEAADSIQYQPSFRELLLLPLRIVFLVSPLGTKTINAIVEKKVDDLKRMKERKIVT